MIYPFADKLENLGSKYALVVLAAKRAKQIKSGVSHAIETDSRNPLTIALEEVAMGKIKCEVPDNDLVATTSVEPEVAQLLAIPGREDEELAAEAGAALEEETPLAIEDETQLEEEEGLEDWEDTEEDEVVPLDKHLESGIIIDPDEDTDEESQDVLDVVDEPKPKTRGRRKAAPEPEPDLDVDIDVDAEIEDVDLDADDLTDEEE